jgi:hypothetical protein
MEVIRIMGSLEALRRKLRALTAVADDSGSTAPEKANARALKKILEERLRDAEAPARDWTDSAFRLGRWVKDMRKSTSPAAPKGDWTDNAHRLGRGVRRSYKKWLSESAAAMANYPVADASS